MVAGRNGMRVWVTEGVKGRVCGHVWLYMWGSLITQESQGWAAQALMAKDTCYRPRRSPGGHGSGSKTTPSWSVYKVLLGRRLQGAAPVRYPAAPPLRLDMARAWTTGTTCLGPCTFSPRTQARRRMQTQPDHTTKWMLLGPKHLQLTPVH